MKKILLLGGGGFIGRHLASELADDYAVIVADINMADENKVDGVSYVVCDFVLGQDLSRIVKDADIIINLICTILPEDGTGNMEKEISDNVFPVVRLLDSIKDIIPKKKLFFISSGGTVYGNSSDVLQKERDQTWPICKYGFVKSITEQILELYHVMHGVQYCNVRIANPYGTKMRRGQRQGLIPILADCVWNDNEFTLWGDGEAVRDYIHISDVAKAMRLLIEYDGMERVFNLGSGKGHSVNDVIKILERHIGRKYNKLVRRPPRLCDVKSNVLDISLLTECTGWKPEINLEEGIVKLVQSYERRQT